MSGPREPLFVARQTYRRRRLTDALRLVPVLGVLLFLIPILKVGGGGASTARGGLYIFLVWLGLICLAAVLATRQRTGEAPDAAQTGGDPQ